MDGSQSARGVSPGQRAPTEPVETPNSDNNASPGHIHMTEPERPQLFKRNTFRGESHRSLRDAVRLERSREEQETLLGDTEQADDDGCYPPRKNDDPRIPNPHAWLPVYTTIHKVRRLVLASIGASLLRRPGARSPMTDEASRAPQMTRIAWSSSRVPA